MEVKINKEVREFSEAVFFGMSLRQCVFAALACGVAVALYFLLSPYLGIETLSWVCILGAAPFAALGFIKWHGMSAEQFVWAWIKSEVLSPKRLLACPTNLYYDAVSHPMKQRRQPKNVKGPEEPVPPIKAPKAGQLPLGDEEAKPLVGSSEQQAGEQARQDSVQQPKQEVMSEPAPPADTPCNTDKTQTHRQSSYVGKHARRTNTLNNQENTEVDNTHDEDTH